VLIILPTSGPAQIVQNLATDCGPSSNLACDGPFDGNDDTLVGILNQNDVAIPTVALSSTTDIFAFDGDGICSGNYGTTWVGETGCPYGTTGYEGPGTSFSGYSSSNHYETGNVNFGSTGLTAGSSTFFSLESSLNAATFSVPASFTILKSVTSSGTYYAGDTSTPITYSLSAKNIGQAAGAITITDTVPTNTTLVGSPTCTTVPAGASCTPSVSGTSLTWTVTGVPPGDTVTVGFSVTPNASTSNYTVDNTGAWTGDGCVTTPSCSTDTTMTPVTAPQAVTITADNTTSTYGTAPATPGYTTSPTVTISTPPTCSTSVTATTPVGTVANASVCKNASDPAYTFTYKNGTGTVNPAPLKVTASSGSMNYGGAVPTISPTFLGLENGDNPTLATTCSTLATSTSPAGSYASNCTISSSWPEFGDYTITYVPGTVTVGKATLTVTASSDTSVYGSAPATITPTFTGLQGSDNPSASTTCSANTTVTTPVGTYSNTSSCTISSSWPEYNNYTIVYVNGTITVTPAPLTVTATGGSFVYGGTPPAITANDLGLRNGDNPTSATTCSTTATSTSPVGSYPSSCSVSASWPQFGDYTITYVDGAVSVTAAPLTVTASSGSFVYGGTPPTITAGYTGLQNGDNPGSATTCSTIATSTSPVGPYTSSCLVSSSWPKFGDYSITYVPGTVTVTPAPLTVMASSGSFVYGGTVPTITPGYTGLQNGDNPGSATTCSTTATSTSPVGPYPSSCLVSSSWPKFGDYTITYVPGTVSVTKGGLTVTASSGSFVYGGTPPTITPTFGGLKGSDNPGSSTTCSTTATSSSPVASYPSSCTISASWPQFGNYTITYVSGTVAVTPAPLMVTASSGTFVYGGTPPTITPTFGGLKGSDNPASSTTCSTGANSSTSPVGSYSSNCSISSSWAQFGNYTITYVPGTVTVTPAPLTVTASSGTFVYGGTPPTITPNFSGLKGSDNPGSSTTCSTIALTTSPVGSYPSTCSISATWAQYGNYTITYVPGAVTVTPAPLTVTASSGSMTYGGTPPTITPIYAGLVNSDSAPTVAPICTTNATSSSQVSGNPYTSSCTGAVDTNYTISYVKGTVTVDPAPLTITASSPTIILGATIPTITPSYTGLVNGDAAPTTLPTCSTTATGSSPTGTYPTSCSGAADPNYTISYVSGSLTITPGFTVVKSVSPSGGVVAGSTTPIVYTLVATNSGVATTSAAATIADSVPTGTTLVSGSPACEKGGPPTCTVAVSGNTITWTIPSGVAPGAAYTLTFSVTANASDAAGTISNTAIWSGPGCVAGANSMGCDTNTAGTTVSAAPVTAPATVTPPPAAPAAAPVTPVSTAPAIAFTGALLEQEWIVGGSALLLGTALLLISRRRRSPKHADRR
jgi:hypothetical protein